MLGAMASLAVISMMVEARSCTATTAPDESSSGRDHRAACEVYCADAGGELVELHGRPDLPVFTCMCEFWPELDPE
jgi:hypothetical protein